MYFFLNRIVSIKKKLHLHSNLAIFKKYTVNDKQFFQMLLCLKCSFKYIVHIIEIFLIYKKKSHVILIYA